MRAGPAPMRPEAASGPGLAPVLVTVASQGPLAHWHAHHRHLCSFIVWLLPKFLF